MLNALLLVQLLKGGVHTYVARQNNGPHKSCMQGNAFRATEVIRHACNAAHALLL